MVPRDQAHRRAWSAAGPSTRRPRSTSPGSTCCRSAGSSNDEKVADHHAIIPTNSEHKLDKMSDDDRRIYDMVVRRFLAVFHPEAVFENTRVETTVAEHIFRTRGKVLVVPGWRGVYGESAEGERSPDEEDEGRDQQLPKLEQGEDVDDQGGRLRSRRRPSRRGATPTRRCWARWRPPASSSTTTSCARR